MPPVAAAIGAAVAKISISTILVNLAVSLALSAVTKMLTKPKRPKSSAFTGEAVDRQHVVRSPVSSHRVIYGRSVVSGTLVFASTTGQNKEFLHMVVALAGHACDGVEAVWFNDRPVGARDANGDVTTGEFAGFARVRVHLGADDQAADAAAVGEIPEWTGNHRLRGITYAYVRLKWDSDQKVFPSGIPTPKFQLRGRAVYDPRTATTAWSANAALCALDYLIAEHGFGADYATEIDAGTWIAAANECDEAVALASGGSEARYTANGTFTRNERRRSVIEKLLTAMGGTVAYHQGRWRGHAAVATSPTRAALTESDLRAPIRVRPRAERSSLFNAVRGTYTQPAQLYRPADFPAVTNATYAAQDGETIHNDIELPYTSSAATAQRLAKIELELHRQAITVEFPAKLTALNVAVMDVVPVTIARLGWSDKPFRCLGWALSDDGGVNLVLREEAAASYDWNSGLETTIDPAPNTNLPSPSNVRAPTDAAAASGNAHLYVAADGTVRARILLTWSAPEDQFVAGYDVEFKRNDVASWSPLGRLQRGLTQTYVTDVQDGVLYDLRVRAINGLGIPSNWNTITHTVVGKTAPPPNVTTFLVQRQPDGTREFRWTLTNPPADLAGYQVRAKLGTGHAWADLTPLHEGLLVSSPWETNLLAAGIYTAGIKAIDTSGNESEGAKIIQSTLGDPRIVGAIVVEDFMAEGWPGTKTDSHVEPETGHLADDGAATWDGLGDALEWDALESWGNGAIAFSYEHPEIDVGADAVFVPLTSVTVDRGQPTIEYAYKLDGGTYGAFAEITAAITARYIKVRISVAPDVGAVDCRLSQALFIASGTPAEEDVNDLDMTDGTFQASSNYIGVGDIRIPITKSYGAINRVGIALQNVGPGWTWEIVDRDADLGPRVRIYNNAGALANTTIDAHVRGVQGA